MQAKSSNKTLILNIQKLVRNNLKAQHDTLLEVLWACRTS